LKIKGEELASAKQELEHLETDGGLTPDDLIKVKSGHGNVADAKTLGYLKKRKSRKRSNNTKSKLQEKRSHSKNMNQNQNNHNSILMKEKIINMEQERANLIKQADMLKKRDDSIDNLMDKYVTKSGKKAKPQNRSNLMSKIKERMSNLEKGKSIEIHESKRGRDQRLRREHNKKDESFDHEGGENEDKENKLDEGEQDQQDEAEGDQQDEAEENVQIDEDNNVGGDQVKPPSNDEARKKSKFISLIY